jgi:hypothetical protein
MVELFLHSPIHLHGTTLPFNIVILVCLYKIVWGPAFSKKSRKGINNLPHLVLHVFGLVAQVTGQQLMHLAAPPLFTLLLVLT